MEPCAPAPSERPGRLDSPKIFASIPPIVTASSHRPVRILILTASMGEGHNTAARNIKNALALESPHGVETLVVDPYTRTNPVVNRLIQRG